MAYLLKLKVVDLQIVDAGAGVAISEGDTMMVLKNILWKAKIIRKKALQFQTNNILTERVEQEK